MWEKAREFGNLWKSQIILSSWMLMITPYILDRAEGKVSTIIIKADQSIFKSIKELWQKTIFIQWHQLNNATTKLSLKAIHGLCGPVWVTLPLCALGSAWVKCNSFTRCLTIKQVNTCKVCRTVPAHRKPSNAPYCCCPPESFLPASFIEYSSFALLSFSPSRFPRGGPVSLSMFNLPFARDC